MRLIAYCRVSTVGQVNDGLGLPTQERLIRAWARAGGHKLARIATDAGRSGALAETDRPGLLDALGALRAGEASGLVVTSLDRLARALTTQEAILGRVWSSGARVFTVDGGEVLTDDPDDPMRTAIRQVVGVFNELDRRLIVKRLRNGRQTAATQGRRGSGRSPYGWQSVKGVLVPVANEQSVIERIKASKADGLSLARIATQLNAEGVSAKAGRWHPSTVGAVLQREASRAAR